MSTAELESEPKAHETAQARMIVVNPLVEGMAAGGSPLLHGALPRFNHAVTTGLVMVTPVYALTVYQVLKATRAHLAKSGAHLSASHWRQLLAHASAVLSKQRFAPTVAFFTLLHMLDYAWRSQLGLGQGAQHAAQLQSAALHRIGAEASAEQAATMSAFTAVAPPAAEEQPPPAALGEDADEWQAMQALLERAHVDAMRQAIETAWAASGPKDLSPLARWRQRCAQPRVPCLDMRQASKHQEEYAHPAAEHLGRALPLLPFADVAVPLVCQTASAASAAEAASSGANFSTQWPSTNLKALSPPRESLLATCVDSAAAVRGWSIGPNPLPYADTAELLTSMPWYDAMLLCACRENTLADMPLGASIALTVQPLLGGGGAFGAWAVSTPLDTMLSHPERLALRSARARVILMARHRLQAGAQFADSATALSAERSSAATPEGVAVSHRDVCAWSNGVFAEHRVEALQDILQAAAQPVAVECIARAVLLKAGLALPGSGATAASSVASCPPWALAARPVDSQGDPVVFRLPLLALQPDQVARGVGGASSLFATALSTGGALQTLPSVLQQMLQQQAQVQQEADEASGQDNDIATDAAVGDDAAAQPAPRPVNALDIDLVDIRPVAAQQLATEPSPANPQPTPTDDTPQPPDLRHMQGIFRAVAFAAEFAQQEHQVQLLNGQAPLEHATAIRAAHELADATKHAFATHSSAQQCDVSPILWPSAGGWIGSPMGIISAASDVLRQPEWAPVRTYITQHTHALQLPQIQAVAAFATNSLPVGVEPRDGQRLLPYLQFSSLGGLVGAAAGATTAVLFKKQTMAWTQVTPFGRHVSIAAAAGAMLGAFTSSYEEGLRPLAAVFNGAH